MKPSPARRALAALFLLATVSCRGIADPGEEYTAARRAADRWVQRHPTGWTLSLKGERALTRPTWSRGCADRPESGFTALRYAAEDVEIDLFFRCPVGDAAGAADLARAFSHAVLQELPHGIESRGWRFDVRMPSSSVSEKVTFSAPAPGRLVVGVETPLHAVYGHSVRTACQPPADAPSPEGCYLSREHRIPLSLTLTVPFQGTELR